MISSLLTKRGFGTRRITRDPVEPVFRGLPHRCRCLSSTPLQLQDQKQALVDEASALTRSLFRICIRSVRLIRAGNENDEKEFVEREQTRLHQPPGEGRLSMLSMLPPVDRQDELRSRAEYYMQYARENFVQESDCLSHSDWKEQHVARYLHHLRRGEEHRKWLLADMKFVDPYQRSFDHSRVKKYEEKALEFVGSLGVTGVHSDNRRGNNSQNFDEYHVETEEAAFDDDDDDDATHGLPSWYKNPRSQ